MSAVPEATLPGHELRRMSVGNAGAWRRAHADGGERPFISGEIQSARFDVRATFAQLV